MSRPQTRPWSRVRVVLVPTDAGRGQIVADRMYRMRVAGERILLQSREASHGKSNPPLGESIACAS